MTARFSHQCSLPAHQFDLYTFDDVLSLFEGEFEHLICQADLPTSVITEDAAAFRDALSVQALATNIRVRGWTRDDPSSIRLGELLLTDHRADVRVDGYPDRRSAEQFTRTVREAAVASRQSFGWIHSPWLLAAGVVVGTLAGLIYARGTGSPSWPVWVIAGFLGALAGLAGPLVFASLAQLAVPYAGVKGLGLRSRGRFDLRPDALAGPEESRGTGRGVA